MKNIYLFILSLFLLKLSFGQIHAGFKAGLNLASVKMGNDVNNKAILRFYAGALTQVGLSEKFYIQPEILYSIKGYRAPSISFENDDTVTLHYINVPLLLGYRLNKTLSIFLGPEFGFLTNAERKSFFSFDVSKDYKDFDFGIDLELACNLNKNIVIDVRYNYGLKNVGNLPVRDRNYNRVSGQNTNQVLQLGLAYIFSR